ncbi:GNAT family N-acetyltransferase [Solihabitans fulvus]|uniref:GNAT family N-acetyltransferase n=1 Tax=Solihabitans fulvus TaxID=1892852 RepID=A0A5B2XR63_9PSEU|nr:GNAT family N-acetyltransferase [Solihabitans fulvus]KAA2265329.1 GNAT family N-acetyltransferase [Solihabitans fulvus]
MTAPELRTDRLLLRPLRADDLNAMVRVYEHPDTSHFFTTDRSDPAEVARFVDGRLAAQASGPAGLATWVFVHGDEVVGHGHVMPSRALPPELLEIGWVLGKDHWGRGFAAEAASAMVEHGLHTLGLPALWALVHQDNGSSRRLAGRLGFLDVGGGDYYGGPHRVLVRLPAADTTSTGARRAANGEAITHSGG